MGSEGFQERFVNPYTDFGFKKLFGTELNKELLISFLNALLPEREQIVFDVYCTNEKGERFLVEMQRGEQQFFKDRSLYYATFPIREQACRGNDWDYRLKAVYVIGILESRLCDRHPELHDG